jgi:hypothetical protein
MCGIFATIDKYFDAAILPGEFFVSMSPTCNRFVGGRRMSIEMVLLIVILTFAIGYVLNRLDTDRPRARRQGSPPNGISGGPH